MLTVACYICRREINRQPDLNGQSWLRLFSKNSIDNDLQFSEPSHLTRSYMTGWLLFNQTFNTVTLH